MPKTIEKPLHSTRFPGESPEYRSARDQLLKAELGLRQQIEEVTALRRRLPLGGPLKEDYVFEEGGPDLDRAEGGKPVRLSELFRPGKDSLLIYSFMFGPEMKEACPSCTSILDGLNGSVLHARDRINLAVVAKSPIERIREFARGRGWRNLRLLSSARNSYNADYHAETAGGDQIPALNVFVRRGAGSIISIARSCSTTRGSRGRIPGTWTRSGRCGACSTSHPRDGAPTGTRG